jgi:hypothetical protein
MSAFASGSYWGYRRRKPTLEDRLIARMLARSLDRELAGGVSAWVSGAHAARSGQLATDRARHAVANDLDRLIERAAAPASRLQITAVPCCDQVRQATDIMRAIAARLRSVEPLDPRGIACLRTLLSDPAGPFRTPGPAGALTVALRDVSELLELSAAERR